MQVSREEMGEARGGNEGGRGCESGGWMEKTGMLFGNWKLRG